MDALLKLAEEQRPVVVGGGQAEAVLHQGILPGAVAVVHGAYLRDGDVALVNEADEILGEIVQQGIGRVPRLAAVKVAAVILDALAVADLTHHFDVIIGALGNALGLQQLALLFELGHPLLQVALDDGDVFLHVAVVGGVVGSGEYRRVLQGGQHMAADHLDFRNAVDLVPEEFHPQGVLVFPGGDDLHRIPPHAEGAANEIQVVALVLNLDELAQQGVPVHGHARAQGDHLPLVLAGVAHGIDAAHRGHDDHVPALPQGGGGAVAQAVDFIVDGGVLLDIGIRGGDVRLGLVIIVIADEVFHPAVREEGAKLAAQLGRQGLVVGDDQGGPLHPLDDRGHGEGFARAGNAQQHLALQPLRKASGQGFDGLGLIPAGAVGGLEYKTIHGWTPPCAALMFHGPEACSRSMG